MAQLVELPALAQVMISWFMSLSPALGSLLAVTTDLALDSLSLLLSASPLLVLSLSLSK